MIHCYFGNKISICLSPQTTLLWDNLTNNWILVFTYTYSKSISNLGPKLGIICTINRYFDGLFKLFRVLMGMATMIAFWCISFVSKLWKNQNIKGMKYFFRKTNNPFQFSLTSILRRIVTWRQAAPSQIQTKKLSPSQRVSNAFFRRHTHSHSWQNSIRNNLLLSNASFPSPQVLCQRRLVQC